MSSSGIVSTGSWVTEPALPLEHAGAFEDRGEVGVHVRRVAASPGDLLARGGDLAQRLAVVGDVGHHHQHVHAVHEGEVLGARQAGPRREQALDGRVLRLIQEQDGAIERRGGGEAIEERARLALGDADGHEDDREGLAPRRPRVLDDGRGQIERRQARAGEHRELLAAHERVHAVDGGDARSR